MKPSLVLLFLPLLWGSPVAAQTEAEEVPGEMSDAAKAAEVFSLDLAATETETDVPPTALVIPPPPAPRNPAPFNGTLPSPAPTGAIRFTLDTPIAELIADTRAKAVLDRHLPGMSGDKNLDKFRARSLRQLQPVSGGRLTDAMMAETARDLAMIRDTRLPPGR